MMDNPHKTLVSCLRLVLVPVIRFCLRRSLYIQDLLEAAKVVYIEQAAIEIKNSNDTVNISRLAAMTGLHRRDVMRIYRDEEIKEAPQGLTSRIIGQWQQDPRFITKTKKPRVLTLEGETSEFKQLVQRVSNDLNATTVLFELERIGAVERVKEGVRLTTRAYNPKGNVQEGFGLLARDTEDLLAAVEDNLFREDVVPHLHAKTEYDRVVPEAVPLIKKWLFTEGSALHQKARNFIAKFDQDTNPELPASDSHVRVVLGTFSHIASEDQK